MPKATTCNTCGHNRLQVLDKTDGYSLVTPLTPHIGEFLEFNEWDKYVVSCLHCHAVEPLFSFMVRHERGGDDS